MPDVDPTPSELPSPRALRRASVIAVVVAAFLFVAAVLPAEYNVDPTGIGGLTGLKEIGEIKQDAVQEAADAARVDSARAASRAAWRAGESTAAPSAVVDTGARADTVSVALHPNEGKEIKLVMRKGARARYAWSVDRGAVNVELHGDTLEAPPGVFHSYKRGRGVAADSGTFEAVFAGNHGWYWRNRTADVVIITLRTEGAYRELKQMD